MGLSRSPGCRGSDAPHQRATRRLPGVRDLFGCETTVTLYDLTNTYFEGAAAANPQAARGRSKEKRSDCPLVTLARARWQRLCAPFRDLCRPCGGGPNAGGHADRARRSPRQPYRDGCRHRRRSESHLARGRTGIAISLSAASARATSRPPMPSRSRPQANRRSRSRKSQATMAKKSNCIATPRDARRRRRPSRGDSAHGSKPVCTNWPRD